jgi:hypothetical protein
LAVTVKKKKTLSREFWERDTENRRDLARRIAEIERKLKQSEAREKR